MLNTKSLMAVLVAGVCATACHSMRPSSADRSSTPDRAATGASGNANTNCETMTGLDKQRCENPNAPISPDMRDDSGGSG